jgi:hypothetical protein
MTRKDYELIASVLAAALRNSSKPVQSNIAQGMRCVPLVIGFFNSSSMLRPHHTGASFIGD